MADKKIVILGGSYGGISTAHYLLKHVVPHLPNNAYEVVLVSPSSEVINRTACPRALISEDMFDQKKLFTSIPKCFDQYPEGQFRFVQGTATHLDHEGRTLSVNLRTGESKSFPFHALVIATGASTPSPLHGLNSDSGESLRANWISFRKVLTTAKTIMISGGGPAGVETAAELGEFLNGKPGWFGRKLKNPKVKITIVTAGPQILPLLRPSIAQQAEAYLSKIGVTVIKNARVKAVDPYDAGTLNVDAKAVIMLEDGQTLEADLYIPATGTKPNTDFVNGALLTANGRVETNPFTLRVDKAGPRIYAIGDASSYARPGIHLITNAIPVLGSNIKRDLLLESGIDAKSVGEDKIHKEDISETQIVPLGTNKGVGAAMGYRLPSFVVWLLKGRDYWMWTLDKLWSGRQW